MTPGGEQSAWVTSEIAYARQLGRPVLPLLLGGTTFGALADLPVQTVLAGEMPDQAFLDHLRAVAPYPQGPQDAGPQAVGPQAVGLQASGGLPPWAPAAAPRRTGRIVGIVAAAAVLLLCLVGVVGFGAWQLSQRDDPSGPISAGGTWEDQANSIDGIQNFLVSHPEWYAYDPEVGNHGGSCVPDRPRRPVASTTRAGRTAWATCTRADRQGARDAQHGARRGMDHLPARPAQGPDRQAGPAEVSDQSVHADEPVPGPGPADLAAGLGLPAQGRQRRRPRGSTRSSARCAATPRRSRRPAAAAASPTPDPRRSGSPDRFPSRGAGRRGAGGEAAGDEGTVLALDGHPLAGPAAQHAIRAIFVRGPAVPSSHTPSAMPLSHTSPVHPGTLHAARYRTQSRGPIYAHAGVHLPAVNPDRLPGIIVGLCGPR